MIYESKRKRRDRQDRARQSRTCQKQLAWDQIISNEKTPNLTVKAQWISKRVLENHLGLAINSKITIQGPGNSSRIISSLDWLRRKRHWESAGRKEEVEPIAEISRGDEEVRFQRDRSHFFWSSEIRVQINRERVYQIREHPAWCRTLKTPEELNSLRSVTESAKREKQGEK